jgi:NAD-dependent deacetylase
MCVGAVGAIEPIASFPFVAKRARAYVLAIDDTDSMYALIADHVIPATPGAVLPDLVRAVAGASNEAGAEAESAA